MNITVLGTGAVGRTLAARLDELGHNVAVGTRDVQHTLSRPDADGAAGASYADWQQVHPTVRLMAFQQAGAHGQLLINATQGRHSLSALEAVGAPNLAGKVLLDLALPLDLSHGMPPEFTIAGDDSLGERIQRTFPEARVVKTLNTVYMDVMVDPARVPGRHNLFIAGDDSDAKETVRQVLRRFGWPDDAVIDLGGIRGARGTESYMQLYFLLAGLLGHFDFNITVATASTSRADVPDKVEDRTLVDAGALESQQARRP